MLEDVDGVDDLFELDLLDDVPGAWQLHLVMINKLTLNKIKATECRRLLMNIYHTGSLISD